MNLCEETPIDLLNDLSKNTQRAAGDFEVFYWRERNHEVDFVVKAGRRLTAIEVKSGRAPPVHPGTVTFAKSVGASARERSAPR